MALGWKRRQRLKKVIMYCLLGVVLVIVLFPIFALVTTSFKHTVEVRTYPPLWISKSPTVVHYLWLMGRSKGQYLPARPFALVLRPLVNSLIIASANTVIAIMIGTLAAYSFARFRVGGFHLSFWVLSVRMLPPIASVIPLFLLFRFLGLLDTHIALIFAYLAFNIPFVTWLMRGFFLEIPEQLEESAMLDGCGRLGAFVKVALPLAAPGLAVVTIFCFIFSYSEFMLALILSRDKAKTAPLLIAQFRETLPGQDAPMAAAAILVAIPVIILGILVQKYIVKGLTLGALK